MRSSMLAFQGTVLLAKGAVHLLRIQIKHSGGRAGLAVRDMPAGGQGM